MTEKTEITAQFLITEYTSIFEKAKQIDEIKSTRVNFFLGTVGLISAGIAAAVNDLSISNIQNTIFLSSTVLLLLGLFTLHFCQNYSVDSVHLARRAGRIRRWFLCENQKLAPFLVDEPSDDTPQFALGLKGLMRRGAEPVLLVLNSFLITIISYLIVIAYIPMLLNHFQCFPVVQISKEILNTLQIITVLWSFWWGVYFFFVQLFWVRYRMSDEQRKSNIPKRIDGVMFPSDNREIRKLIEDYFKNLKQSEEST